MISQNHPGLSMMLELIRKSLAACIIIFPMVDDSFFSQITEVCWLVLTFSENPTFMIRITVWTGYQEKYFTA